MDFLQEPCHVVGHGAHGLQAFGVEGGLAFLAVVFSFVMLFIDLLYTVIDPRLKDEFNANNKMAANKRAAKRKAREAARASAQA